MKTDKEKEKPLDIKQFFIELKEKRKLMRRKGIILDYQCPFKKCGKIFKQYNSLQKHLRIHTGERPYKCTFEGCNKSFTQISNLKRHMNKHLGKKSFQCLVCLKAFGTKSNLKQHQLTHNRSKAREKFKCKYPGCNKIYLHPCSLKKHVKSDHECNKVINYEKIAQQSCCTTKSEKSFDDEMNLTGQIRKDSHMSFERIHFPEPQLLKFQKVYETVKVNPSASFKLPSIFSFLNSEKSLSGGLRLGNCFTQPLQFDDIQNIPVEKSYKGFVRYNRSS